MLRRAAVEAAHHGAPHTAAAYLERALKERAAGDDRGRLLAELATVAFDAGLPDSRERLREALAEAHDRDSRLDVLTRLAALNVVDIDEPGCRRSSSRSWPPRPIRGRGSRSRSPRSTR